MTSPRKRKRNDRVNRDVFAPNPVSKANWLGRYLPIEDKAIKAINSALHEAERSISETLAKTENIEEPNISTGIRRAQLNLDLRAVRQAITQLFGTVTNTIRDHQTEAALAAVDAGFFDDRQIMSKLFPNTADRQNFTQSFRRTAERNVQSMMTRILGTQQPLSRRVWKTRALAQGYVDRAVNNALARGDSYKNLAKSVEHLVKPDTPGGISYAAKRLARTEINNAFHAQAISDSEEKPWVNAMEWNLSKRHEDDPGDLCEVYELQKEFQKEQVPKKPHPNCRCFVTPKLIDYDTFEDQLIQGNYDSYINRIMGNDKYIASQVATAPTIEAPIPVVEVIPYEPPPFDIESATKPQEVAKLMGEKYPHISFLNWTPKNTTLEAAKQYAQALDEMLTQFPDNGLDVVSFASNPEIEYGRTLMATNGRSLILFNKHYSLDPTYTYERMTHDVHTHFHVPRSDERPYYQTAIHEFGHVLDAYTGIQVKNNSIKDLAFKLAESDFDVTPEGFLEWFHANMVKYGFNEDRSINWIESTAEAFADVMLNGNDASEVSKILTRHLISAEPIEGARRLNVVPAQSVSAPEHFKMPDLTDIERAPTPGAVAYALEKKHGLAVLNFNSENIDVESAKEIARAVNEVLEEFPNSGLTNIALGWGPDFEYARTLNIRGKSTIKWNLNWTRDPNNYKRHMHQNVDDGFHPARSDERPFYSMMLHELGHVIDNAGGGKARDKGRRFIYKEFDTQFEHEVDKLYKDLWEEKAQEEEKKLFVKWLKDEMPSTYSFTGDEIESNEVLAEAFTDVRINGENAKPISKKLYKLMVRFYQEEQGNK